MVRFISPFSLLFIICGASITRGKIPFPQFLNMPPLNMLRIYMQHRYQASQSDSQFLSRSTLTYNKHSCNKSSLINKLINETDIQQRSDCSGLLNKVLQVGHGRRFMLQTDNHYLMSNGGYRYV